MMILRIILIILLSVSISSAHPWFGDGSISTAEQAAIAANTSHSGGDGSDHADVATNTAYNRTQIDQPATDTLSAAECKNKVITNRGQSGEATQTLPAAAEGLYFTAVIVTTGYLYHWKPATGEIINFDGTALDANDKITASATASALDKLVFFTYSDDGKSTWKWAVETVRGSEFSDGGA